MTVEIRNSVAYWDDLTVGFSQSNRPRVFHFRNELGSINQGNMTITSYFIKFRTLLVEIDNLDPMPKCKCNARACTCQNLRNLTNMKK